MNVKAIAEKIQAVINTLEDLDIKSTFNNMNKLLGCQGTLAEVRDELMKAQEEKHGNADV